MSKLKATENNFLLVQKKIIDISSNNNLTVIPLKDFNNSKSRLKEILSDTKRVELVKKMLEKVISGLNFKCVVVSNSDKVSEFASQLGVDSIVFDRVGLNKTAEYIYENLELKYISRLTVVHADLPFAEVASNPLNLVQTLDNNKVLIYPDQSESGTTVLSVPAGLKWKFKYGKNSFIKHIDQAHNLNLKAEIVKNFNWSFDVDTKSDLIKYYETTDTASQLET
jgi:2-phospho-L-lactate guanylyltransferase